MRCINANGDQTSATGKALWRSDKQQSLFALVRLSGENRIICIFRVIRTVLFFSLIPWNLQARQKVYYINAKVLRYRSRAAFEVFGRTSSLNADLRQHVYKEFSGYLGHTRNDLEQRTIQVPAHAEIMKRHWKWMSHFPQAYIISCKPWRGTPLL